MNIGYFYMTSKGEALACKLAASAPGTVYDKKDFKVYVEQAWKAMDALVFIMASGIVVRTIAPYIKSKAEDPAVLVLDQEGQFVISLLSGHLGGANALAIKLAKICGGVPVITTATDVAGVPAVDVFAKSNRLTIMNIENVKIISQAMVEHRRVDLISSEPIDGHWPENVVPVKHYGGFPTVRIGYHRYHISDSRDRVLYLKPKHLVLGVGCKRGVDAKQLREAFEDFISKNNIDERCICRLATIALKKDEPCIHALASALHVPLVIFDKEEIEQVDLSNASGKVIEASAFVRQTTGVGSVSEACAYIGANKGKIICPKTKYRGITFALAKDEKALKL